MLKFRQVKESKKNTPNPFLAKENIFRLKFNNVSQFVSVRFEEDGSFIGQYGTLQRRQQQQQQQQLANAAAVAAAAKAAAAQGPGTYV